MGHLVEARGAIAAVSPASAAALRCGHRDMRLWQFVQEARRHVGLPQTVDAAIGGEVDAGSAARTREADMGEAALLFEPGAALLVEGALAREQPFLPTWEEHRVELQALRGMDGHDRDGFGFGGVAVGI